MQERLNEIGTAGTPIEVTGRFDRATEQVLHQFQEDHGIDDDGVVGPLTWEALDRLTTTTSEMVVTGEDLFANTEHDTDADADDAEETVDVEDQQADLNPTSSGDEEWDGRTDDAKRLELKDELIVELQAHLDEVTPGMQDMEAAKAAGNVLSTQEREGAGAAAKRYADAEFATSRRRACSRGRKSAPGRRSASRPASTCSMPAIPRFDVPIPTTSRSRRPRGVDLGYRPRSTRRHARIPVRSEVAPGGVRLARTRPPQSR